MAGLRKRPQRPTKYSQKLADTICERLADGLSLRTICKADDMPAKSTVFVWLASDEKFAAQYALAREAQADTLAEDTLDIADDSANDYAETKDGPKLNPENVQRSRLRYDARRWYASKVAPKKYGDKLELSGDPDRPLLPVINVTVGTKPGA